MLDKPHKEKALVLQSDLFFKDAINEEGDYTPSVYQAKAIEVVRKASINGIPVLIYCKSEVIETKIYGLLKTEALIDLVSYANQGTFKTAMKDIELNSNGYNLYGINELSRPFSPDYENLPQFNKINSAADLDNILNHIDERITKRLNEEKLNRKVNKIIRFSTAPKDIPPSPKIHKKHVINVSDAPKKDEKTSCTPSPSALFGFSGGAAAFGLFKLAETYMPSTVEVVSKNFDLLVDFVATQYFPQNKEEAKIAINVGCAVVAGFVTGLAAWGISKSNCNKSDKGEDLSLLGTDVPRYNNV